MAQQSNQQKWFNVHEDHCVLVEFINERDHLDQKLQQVGYLCWISDEDAKVINDIIEEERQIVINWPNCDIRTPRYMKTLLKRASFKRCTVTVLARGSWISMKQKQKSLETYNVLSPGKSQRKALNSNNNETDELLRSSSQVSIKITKSKSDVEADNSDDDLFTRITKNKPIIDSEDDDENETNPTSPKNLQDIDNSEDGDEMLRLLESKDNEIASSKSIIACLNDDICKLKNELSENERKYALLEKTKVDLEVELECARQDFLNKSDNENVRNQLINAAKDFVLIQNIAKKSIDKISANQCIMKDIGNIEDINSSRDSTISNKKRKSMECPAQSPVLDDDVENSSAADSALKKNRVPSPKKKKLRAPIELYPTNYQLTESQLSNLERTSIATYARDLVGVLFSETELGTHTATGAKCNANKDLPVKPGLDIDRINAAKNECLKVFGKVKGFETLFNYGVKNKCSYCKQRLATKQITE